MEIWLDSADLDEIARWEPRVAGITTNPTIFKNAGVIDPLEHAKRILDLTDKPVCFDGPPELVWMLGAIPKVITEPAFRAGPINHTAVFEPADLFCSYRPDDIVSVFAGRIMDTGRDPYTAVLAAKRTGARALWASVREVYNVQQAEMCGCDIVTVPPAILEKYDRFWAMPLNRFAGETRRQFEADRVDW